ncbi:hypothetical protein QQ045_027499 [Rhodiola kirilowii]
MFCILSSSGKALVGMKEVQAAIQEMFQAPHMQVMRSSSRLSKIFLAAMVYELYKTGVSETTFEKLAMTVSSLCSSNSEALPDWDSLLRVGCKLGECRVIMCEEGARHRLQKLQLNFPRIEGGDFSWDPCVIKAHLVNYFKESYNGSFPRALIDQVVLSAGQSVREEDCSLLVRSATFNEITDIVKNLPSCKAAGLDGYNSEFFKASWNIIGQDVVNCISSFLRTGVMPSGINATYLALIPKISNASCPKDFRPISCCNVVYKIISTLLANRLKPVLKYLVNQSQSAFIEGRNIAHNISLVQELLGNYKRKHVSKRCMVKLDISKAYDSVEWDFLKQAMEVFGFPVSENEESLLASLPNFSKGQLPINYLGVPLHGKRLKGADYSMIIDKMTSKIKAWSARFLSYAGRLVLIKHVLSCIGSYWMRVLTFPKGVLKKISAICRTYLWSGAAAGKRNLVA